MNNIEYNFVYNYTNETKCINEKIYTLEELKKMCYGESKLIKVNSKDIGKVIGKNGCVIKNIRNENKDAKIKISDEILDGKREIKIESKNAYLIQDLIMSLLIV